MSLRAPDHGAWLFQKETPPTCHCDERSEEAIPNCEGTIFRASFLGAPDHGAWLFWKETDPASCHCFTSRLQDAK